MALKTKNATVDHGILLCLVAKYLLIESHEYITDEEIPQEMTRSECLR
jgi:hypothetical protein